MSRYSLTIPGRPVPKARPRPSPNGHFFIPTKTMDYQRQVAFEAKKVIQTPLVGEVKMVMRLYFRGGRVGDLDNYQKSIWDGLNGVAFFDDRQIRRIECERINGKNVTERAEVEIEETGGDAA